MQKFLITAGPDGMEAFVSFPSQGGPAGKITPEEIAKALKEQGIVHGVDEKRIQEAIDALAAGDRRQSRFTVAQGLPRQAGVPPTVEFRFEEDKIVRKGETLAALRGGTPPRAGRTVRGEEIPLPKKPAESPVEPGENVEYREEDRTCRARLPGYAVRQGRRLSVTPLVHISEDRMSASVTIRAPKGDAPPFSEADLRKMLREAGVGSGLLEGAIEEIMEWTPRAAAPLEGLVVAQGQPPIHGTDAKLRSMFEAETRVGLIMEDGRVDFHQQQPLPPVKAGDIVAVKIPATAGTPGSTVTGETLPARPGKECAVEAAKNVKILPDGLRWCAAVDGAFLKVGNRLWVLDVFEAKGDVDFSTGDLNCPGDVLVRRSIRSNFSVKARGNIVVFDTIEDARVEAGGDVEVKNGIIHGPLGSLAARGIVTAGFANHAEIRAGDSIRIRGSAIHCFLAAGNRVEVQEGKGVVVGGYAGGGECVEVKIAGSQGNVKTVLQAGFDFHALEGLETQLRSIREEMAGILAAAGEKITHYAAAGAPPPADRRLQQLLIRWRQLQKKKEALENRRTQVLRTASGKRTSEPFINVSETVHPGVEIMIADAVLKITDKTSGGRFFLDPSNHEIGRRT